MKTWSVLVCVGQWTVKYKGIGGGGGSRRGLCLPKVRGDMLQCTGVVKLVLRQYTAAVALGRVLVVLIFTGEHSVL